MRPLIEVGVLRVSERDRRERVRSKREVGFCFERGSARQFIKIEEFITKKSSIPIRKLYKIKRSNLKSFKLNRLLRDIYEDILGNLNDPKLIWNSRFYFQIYRKYSEI